MQSVAHVSGKPTFSTIFWLHKTTKREHSKTGKQTRAKLRNKFLTFCRKTQTQKAAASAKKRVARQSALASSRLHTRQVSRRSRAASVFVASIGGAASRRERRLPASARSESRWSISTAARLINRTKGSRYLCGCAVCCIPCKGCQACPDRRFVPSTSRLTASHLPLPTHGLVFAFCRSTSATQRRFWRK